MCKEGGEEEIGKNNDGAKCGVTGGTIFFG